MNDRYLCKAKRTDNGEWVIGYVVKYGYTRKEKYYIVPDYASDLYAIEVDPSTLCQCTGLKDKNSKLIWENDIVKDERGNLYKAFWQSNYYQFSWVCVKSEIFQIGTKWDLWRIKSYEIEVIGNRFDNPEPLESEEK